jgi:cell division protein FtsB
MQSKSKLTAQLPALAGAAKERAYLWRRRAATIATGTLALVMAYGVIFGHNGLTAFAHKREEAKSLQHQMQQLQTENQQLREHVDRLQNDPSAIEHEAREELHYTRAGEVIYTLPPDNSNAANSNAANSDPANSDPANSDAVTTAPSKP